MVSAWRRRSPSGLLRGFRFGQSLLVLGLLLALVHLNHVGETHTHGVPVLESARLNAPDHPTRGGDSPGWDGSCALCGLLSAAAVSLPYTTAAELPQVLRAALPARPGDLGSAEAALVHGARAPPLRQD